MKQIVKCKKCKRIIPTGQKARVGLCPGCFNEVGTLGAILFTGGLVFAGKEVITNSGKIIEVAAKAIKK